VIFESFVGNHLSITIYSPTTLPIIERDQLQSVLFTSLSILLFDTRSHLKIKILVQDQGGAEF